MNNSTCNLVSVDPLGERPPTLDELTQFDVGTKWQQIGIQLKVDVKELNAIEVENKKLWLKTTPDAIRRQLLEATAPVTDITGKGIEMSDQLTNTATVTDITNVNKGKCVYCIF